MNSFLMLTKKFNTIKNLGYVKGINNNRNSAGSTLENLLGSSGFDFNIPDFYDIEIKALRKYYSAEFDLFNSSPDGGVVNAIKWLADNYGYPDKDYRHVKVFKGNVFSNRLSTIGHNYLFRLSINKNKERVYLEIVDYEYNLINKEIFWDFDTLRDKLERKLSKLAVIRFDKKFINNDVYYNFDSVKLYKLISFDRFIECINKGYVYVTFKSGVFKKGKYTGKFTDHGTSFRISIQNIEELFKSVVL